MIRRRRARGATAARTDDQQPDRAAVLAAAVGPAAVEVERSCVRVGDGWAATVWVAGYPATVAPGWLDPLLSWPGRITTTIHIEPVPSETAATKLRRRRARLEAGRRSDAVTGRIGDPVTDAAADDAAELADRLARGESRLFRAGLYVTVHAPTRDELVETVAQLRAVCAGMLLDTHPATWRHLHGWATTLPLGTDALRQRRIVDTQALAAAFPLDAGGGLPGPLPGRPEPAGGVLYGLAGAGDGVLWWNRWTQDNHNSVLLARSGAGKSYLLKLEILRSLYDGVRVAVIDPEAEYTRLAHAVDGTVIPLGAPGVRINPLDIPAGDHRNDALTLRQAFVHTVVAVLLGQPPSPGEVAALDTAIVAAYAAAGISHDPASWGRPAPLLRDVAAALADTGRDEGRSLAAQLRPWTHGSHRALFDGPTTVHPVGQLVVWVTRDLPEELRAPGMLLALDAIWREVDTRPLPPRTRGWPQRGGGPDPGWLRRLVVVDEAWTLLQHPRSAKFLHDLAKRSRKRDAGLAIVTQDILDVLGSKDGQTVIQNAATQILMRQSTQAIDQVTAAFGLTQGEARLLATADRGQALLVAGDHRVAFQVIASDREHHLAAGLTDLPDPGWNPDSPDSPDAGGTDPEDDAHPSPGHLGTPGPATGVRHGAQHPPHTGLAWPTSQQPAPGPPGPPGSREGPGPLDPGWSPDGAPPGVNGRRGARQAEPW